MGVIWSRRLPNSEVHGEITAEGAYLGIVFPWTAKLARLAKVSCRRDLAWLRHVCNRFFAGKDPLFLEIPWMARSRLSLVPSDTTLCTVCSSFNAERIHLDGNWGTTSPLKWGLSNMRARDSQGHVCDELETSMNLCFCLPSYIRMEQLASNVRINETVIRIVTYVVTERGCIKFHAALGHTSDYDCRCGAELTQCAPDFQWACPDFQTAQ
jgi:hypothetical protein